MPDIPHENYWFRRHEIAYRFALPLVDARTVLDVGCGEGYGAALLSATACHVVGLDYDALTIRHAALRYPAAAFARGNLAALPIRSSSVDVVVSMQVVEHMWDCDQFLAECRRVLADGGLLVMSTPNRLTFSPGSAEPMNPFHTKEFTGTELVDLIEEHGFEVDGVFGIHAGDRLRELDRVHAGSFVTAQLSTSPDRWTDSLRRDVAGVRVEDFRISTADVDSVDESLDLLVLAR